MKKVWILLIGIASCNVTSLGQVLLDGLPNQFTTTETNALTLIQRFPGTPQHATGAIPLWRLLSSLGLSGGITSLTGEGTANGPGAATFTLSNGVVTSGKLADGAVTSDKLGAGSVGTAHLLDLNVTTSKINDLAVTAGKLADGAVTTTKLLDLNITSGKLAADSVTSAKIQDGQVASADFAPSPTFTGTVTGPAFAANSIAIANNVTWQTNIVTGTTPSISATNKVITTITLSGNTTITLTDVATTGASSFEIHVVGNGSHTLAFSGPAITAGFGTFVSPPRNGRTELVFRQIGATLYRDVYAPLTPADLPTLTSAELAGLLTDETGSAGGFVRGTGATLVTPLVDDFFDVNEESAPATPGASKVRIYAKADGLVYSKDDAGVETQLGSSGAGTPTDVQIFTTLGANTWTKPANAKTVEVHLIAGGSGGGSGRRGAAGSVRGGGGGGTGGGYTRKTFPAALLGATETVTVGGGGAGGAAETVDDNDGNAGVAGTNTTFGIWLRAGAGGAGQGGTAAGGTGGTASTAEFPGGAGGNASGTGAIGGSGTGTLSYAGGGGAAGGGITSGDAVSNGGTGGSAGTSTRATSLTGGGGATGGAGAAATANEPQGGAAGGGGPSSITGAATAGGAGGIYGGGGGGGGASLNGNNSGAGGAGANGLAIVITYF